MSYLSILRGQVERSPKVVVSRVRVRPAPQQQGHHLSVTAGTCNVELWRERERERSKDKVMTAKRRSYSIW